jgi:hypothetical protein
MYNDSLNGFSIIIGILCLLFIIALFGIKYDTTRLGEHSGYVTAIEQKGFIFHNYNVYFKTDNSSSQEDVYCVQESDVNLANQLRIANQQRKLVTIRYDGVRAWGFNLCSKNKIIGLN